MTRKRVGQGLIEAFSTTCESCGGRGIHVHMEPVNKRSLDREISPTNESEDSQPEEREEKDDDVEVEESKESRKPFGRRRRRAASSGIVTPGGSV
jgi:ribonuclease E